MKRYVDTITTVVSWLSDQYITKKKLKKKTFILLIGVSNH